MAGRRKKRGRKLGSRKAKLVCPPGGKRYTVLAVDGDLHDTHAGRSFESAWSKAQPDRGSRVTVFEVCAKTLEAARFAPMDLQRRTPASSDPSFRNVRRIRSFRTKKG